MTPEMKLAVAIKEAANQYCEETGKPFDVDIRFDDATMLGDERQRILVNSVTVISTIKATAHS